MIPIDMAHGKPFDMAHGKPFDMAHGKLEFDITLIPYTGNDAWVEPTIAALHQCLQNSEMPKAGADCDYCLYVDAVNGKRRKILIWKMGMSRYGA